MGIGLGLILVAAGAILTFAVKTTVSGIDLQTVGVILMIVGGLGVLLDLLIFAPSRRTVIAHDAAPGSAEGDGRTIHVDA